MIVVASANGKIGIPAAMEILRAGGSALDAVEAATRIVEDNPDDHTVGYGGYPNLLGEVELDASIMDGRTLRAGAVGALKGYRHPISVARKVMEELPHVLLVGEGAARFAAEMGFQAENLLTDEAATVYRQGISGALPPDKARDWLSGGIDRNLARLARLTTDPERAAGTVNFIAKDREGNIAVAVSTSGWAWKYPGRLGDSPVIGAGNYADNRYGACACTGWGELALRCGTAHAVVLYQRLGFGLEQACRQAMHDLAYVAEDPARAIMNLIAINRDGRPIGMTTVPGRTYVWMTDDLDAPVEEPRVVIDLTRVKR
ncbi:N(4)-(beta-N-acetylglucosaminyl)-L-asparaginase [Kallotenue papyrolyticum]|uniref:N(4)-(beta-N-acetylglucosaminyl)-L-asparaginase n=1 Tax=Kallotenue papyrolyticum TaxID=1325125 RepID=UPI0004785CFF|nr:N(4)-(beta-N-acetylglucosaminyl)-L-asparaginase [Kallotenue papyrolyticum]